MCALFHPGLHLYSFLAIPKNHGTRFITFIWSTFCKAVCNISSIWTLLFSPLETGHLISRAGFLSYVKWGYWWASTLSEPMWRLHEITHTKNLEQCLELCKKPINHSCYCCWSLWGHSLSQGRLAKVSFSILHTYYISIPIYKWGVSLLKMTNRTEKKKYAGCDLTTVKYMT